MTMVDGGRQRRTSTSPSAYRGMGKDTEYVLVRTHHTPEGGIDSVGVAKLIDEVIAA